MFRISYLGVFTPNNKEEKLRLEVRKQYPRRFRIGAVYERAKVEVPFLNCGTFQGRAQRMFDLRGLHGNVRIIRPVGFWRSVRRGDLMVVLTFDPLQAPDFIQAVHETLAEMAAETEAVRLKRRDLPVVLVRVQSAGGEQFSHWQAIQADLPDLPRQELQNLIGREIYKAELPGELHSVDAFITQKLELIPLITIKARQPWRAGEYVSIVNSLLVKSA